METPMGVREGEERVKVLVVNFGSKERKRGKSRQDEQTKERGPKKNRILQQHRDPKLLPRLRIQSSSCLLVRSLREPMATTRRRKEERKGSSDRGRLPTRSLVERRAKAFPAELQISEASKLDATVEM